MFKMVETRKALRIPTDNTYAVSFEQIACSGFGDIRDISLYGMQFKTIDRVELGAIALHFKLPAFESKETVHGAVVWQDEKRFICGVSFHHVHEQLKYSIVKYSAYASNISPILKVLMAQYDVQRIEACLQFS